MHAATPVLCVIADCASKAKSRGLCNKHYLRWFRTGRTELEPEPPINEELWASTNLAWVAGIVEGEGALNLTSTKRDGKRASLRVKMSDRDVVERLYRIMGCGTFRGPYPGPKKHHKPLWEWTVARKSHLRAVLTALKEWFGQRRSHKANALLEFLST